jgi:hypothetical protein
MRRERGYSEKVNVLSVNRRVIGCGSVDTIPTHSQTLIHIRTHLVAVEEVDLEIGIQIEEEEVGVTEDEEDLGVEGDSGLDPIPIPPPHPLLTPTPTPTLDHMGIREKREATGDSRVVL